MKKLVECGFFKLPIGGAVIGGVAGFSLFTAGLFTGVLPSVVALTMASFMLSSLVSTLAGATLGYFIARKFFAEFAEQQNHQALSTEANPVQPDLVTN